MRKHIQETLGDLPDEIDTVLVAMGFCGGSWQDVTCVKKLVIPRVDDCVSLVMTTTDVRNPCMKQLGHMYVFGGESGGFSIGGIYDCYDLEFVEAVQADADRIHADIDYVPGSNLLLEKLVSGRWDEQFFIVEPNKRITQGNFLMYREMRSSHE